MFEKKSLQVAVLPGQVMGLIQSQPCGERPGDCWSGQVAGKAEWRWLPVAPTEAASSCAAQDVSWDSGTAQEEQARTGCPAAARSQAGATWAWWPPPSSGPVTALPRLRLAALSLQAGSSTRAEAGPLLGLTV